MRDRNTNILVRLLTHQAHQNTACPQVTGKVRTIILGQETDRPARFRPTPASNTTPTNVEWGSTPLAVPPAKLSPHSRPLAHVSSPALSFLTLDLCVFGPVNGARIYSPILRTTIFPIPRILFPHPSVFRLASVAEGDRKLLIFLFYLPSARIQARAVLGLCGAGD